MSSSSDGMEELSFKRRRCDRGDENPSGSATSNPSTATTLPDIQQVSNLADVTPVVGMTLEIRDSDYIWSSGRLVKVDEDDSGDTQVTVRCDGWGPTWDEQLTWPSERLARLYTYTKRVKCLVSLLPPTRSKKHQSRKVQYSNSWPCTVQFRMPHPFQKGCSDEQQCIRAEELLVLEVNVFVQPYGVSFLPKYIVQSLDEDGGRWLNASRLRLWRDDPSELGICPKNFEKAYEEAKNDMTVQGFLPIKAVGAGSLVHDMYRVRDAEGAVTDGVMRANAATMDTSRSTEKMAQSKPTKVTQPKPPRVVRVEQTTVSEKTDEHPEDDQYRPPKYQPPPTFPLPIRTEPVYPGVTRCKKSNQWVASVSMRGNDLFLGSFPTQTQAWNATRMANTKQAKGTTAPTDLVAARQSDLEAVPLEAIIDATENQLNPATNNFSLHQWTLQHARHAGYLWELEHGRAHFEASKARAMKDSNVAKERTEIPVSHQPAKKGRKQSRPLRVDMGTGNYT